MRGHTGSVVAIALSADGSRIVSGSDDKTVRIWDVQTGSETQRLDGHKSRVNSVAFSSDGQRIWDSQTGQTVGTPLIEHTHRVQDVFFSPDDLHIISGSLDFTICIWSAVCKWHKPSQKITCIHLSRQSTPPPKDRISLEGHPCVVSACYSPDGSLYAASTLQGHVSMGRTLLWEINISIHPIHALRLSETQLVLSTADGSILSWNLLDGKPTHDNAISRGPQLNASILHRSTNLSNDAVTSVSTQVYGPLLTVISSDSSVKKDPSLLSISKISCLSFADLPYFSMTQSLDTRPKTDHNILMLILMLISNQNVL